MNFTNIKCINPQCNEANVIMRGNGSHISTPLSTFQIRCPVCELTLMIVPMNEGYYYHVRAELESDIETRIKKEQEFKKLDARIQSLRREV